MYSDMFNSETGASYGPTWRPDYQYNPDALYDRQYFRMMQADQQTMQAPPEESYECLPEVECIKRDTPTSKVRGISVSIPGMFILIVIGAIIGWFIYKRMKK